LRLDEELLHLGAPAVVLRVGKSVEVMACLRKGDDGWHVALFDDSDAELFG
jgi:hypothetical protein